MAGIGFELKKLFQKKGVLNTAKAYGYATAICAGPMLLGMILLLGIMALFHFFEIETHIRELLICMITYTLLVSAVGHDHMTSSWTPKIEVSEIPSSKFWPLPLSTPSQIE